MRKKCVILLAFVLVSLLLGGCFNVLKEGTGAAEATSSRARPTKPSTKATTTETPAETTTSPSSQATTTQKETSQTTSQEATTQSQTQTLDEETYADMLAYDPATGLADFDCFNLLQGDDAVRWLVEEAGYTLAQAQAEVDQFADSEYIEDRPGRQLLAVDISQAFISLLYEPDGNLLLQEVPYDPAAFNAFFDAYPEAVLHSFFYRVTLQAGDVVAVEQVYWP